MCSIVQYIRSILLKVPFLLSKALAQKDRFSSQEQLNCSEVKSCLTSNGEAKSCPRSNLAGVNLSFNERPYQTPGFSMTNLDTTNSETYNVIYSVLVQTTVLRVIGTGINCFISHSPNCLDGTNKHGLFQNNRGRLTTASKTMTCQPVTNRL